MIHQKCSRLHHASGATAGTKAATLTTEGYQMLVAAALAAHAQKTVLQSTTRQVVLELARYVPWQKTTRLTQLRLKLRPVLRYQLVQQCLFGLMPHMGRRTPGILPGCGSAIKRILA